MPTFLTCQRWCSRSGAKRIRMLYDEARKNTPCVVFLDEIDSIGAMRLMNSSSGNSYTSRDTIDQLLAALDGFKSNEGVLTIGATNFPKSLDEALTRPGRFDSKVHLPYPDLKGESSQVLIGRQFVPNSKNRQFAPNSKKRQFAPNSKKRQLVQNSKKRHLVLNSKQRQFVQNYLIDQLSNNLLKIGIKELNK